MDESKERILPVLGDTPEQCEADFGAVAVRGSPDAEVPKFTAFSGPCGNVFGSRIDPNFDEWSVG